MSGEPSGAEPTPSASTAEGASATPNGDKGETGPETTAPIAEAAAGPQTEAAPPGAPVGASAPPKRRRRWMIHLLVGLLAVNLAASVVAIGWIAWIVAGQPRWLDEIQGPRARRARLDWPA